MTSAPRVTPILAPFVANGGLLLLDGGLATELEARGHDLSDALWSARLLRDAPASVRDVHAAYFAAGADLAITASYQASFDGFARVGVGQAEAEDLMRRSVTLAREAAAGAGREGGRPRLVAASVGPYGAALADGSEYRGDYGVDRDVLARFHRRRLEVLVEAGPDLLALETMPNRVEIEVLLELLGELPESAPAAWLSVTCRDGACLRDGTPIESIARRVGASGRVVAFGVNCVAPAHVRSLLERAAAVTDLPLVAYPNRGEEWDAVARAWMSTSGDDREERSERDGAEREGSARDEFVHLARSWHSAGARLIGGCCRTGPADIAALAEAFRGGGE